MAYVNLPQSSRTPPAEELRARIPGWGADLDPLDRPAVPRERLDLVTGAHWEIPEQQEDVIPRERSMEHLRLTPVFGTVSPLKGLSGLIRRFAYERFSEARAAHWLLLIVGDRVDAIESHLISLASRSPDNPVTETGVLSELRLGVRRSRFAGSRADLKHHWIDPLLIAGPWVLVAWMTLRLWRRSVRRR